MIEKSVVLPCDAARAFHLFTREISSWWPPSRRHTSDPASTLTLEPTGRFFERAASGLEVELGRVCAWEPPHRLLLDFYVGTDPEHPTRVEIRFEPLAKGTRVVVDHRPTPISQEMWDQRNARFASSWELVLQALEHAAA